MENLITMFERGRVRLRRLHKEFADGVGRKPWCLSETNGIPTSVTLDSFLEQHAGGGICSQYEPVPEHQLRPKLVGDCLSSM